MGKGASKGRVCGDGCRVGFHGPSAPITQEKAFPRQAVEVKLKTFRRGNDVVPTARGGGDGWRSMFVASA